MEAGAELCAWPIPLCTVYLALRQDGVVWDSGLRGSERGAWGGCLVGRVSLLPDWHPTLGLMVGLWVHLLDGGGLSCGAAGPFRKTSLGLLVPQPLALPLSGTTLGSGPSTLEGDQEPASSVFSGSPAPPEHPQVSYTPGAFSGPLPSGNQLPSLGPPGSLNWLVDPSSLLTPHLY